MEVGGGGDATHAHDGPFNEVRENYARALRVLKRADRGNSVVGNWFVEGITNNGVETVVEDNQRVAVGWNEFPWGGYCGHDHVETGESARP